MLKVHPLPCIFSHLCDNSHFHHFWFLLVSIVLLSQLICWVAMHSQSISCGVLTIFLLLINFAGLVFLFAKFLNLASIIHTAFWVLINDIVEYRSSVIFRFTGAIRMLHYMLWSKSTQWSSPALSRIMSLLLSAWVWSTPLFFPLYLLGVLFLIFCWVDTHEVIHTAFCCFFDHYDNPDVLGKLLSY